MMSTKGLETPLPLPLPLPPLPDDADDTSSPVVVAVVVDVDDVAADADGNNVFWTRDPNVLFRSFEFFPTDKMTYTSKLNAISRAVVVLAIVSFMFTTRVQILVTAAITMFFIAMLFQYQTGRHTRTRATENFKNAGMEIVKRANVPLDGVFDTPTTANPFANVMMADYDFNPHKKPAPPLSTVSANQTMMDSAKQLILDTHPDQPDLADKLFTDLGDQLTFEQSMRPFHSTASTTIPNDQNAFAEFCYGSMVSCKDGNLFACARNLQRYQS